MKKLFVLIIALGLTISACLPAPFQQPEANPQAPVSEPDVQATVAIAVQQTLQALPTPTLASSNTPVLVTATQPTSTETATLPAATTTENPALLTLTATLGVSTLVSGTPAAVNSAFSPTVTETAHYQYYGTMPPYLAYSKITLNNKSKTEVYISLQCTTSEGYKTIIEYPVKGQVEANFPVGKYVYVAWVGGRQITGKFTLDSNQDRIINIFKDHLEIK